MLQQPQRERAGGGRGRDGDEESVGRGAGGGGRGGGVEVVQGRHDGGGRGRRRSGRCRHFCELSKRQIFCHCYITARTVALQILYIQLHYIYYSIILVYCTG